MSLDTSPLAQLYFTRLREFYRQPARIFWVYVFPTVLAIVLGLAFRNRPPDAVDVVVAEGPYADAIGNALQQTGSNTRGAARPEIHFERLNSDVSGKRLRTGRALLVIEGVSPNEVAYHFDPTRPEAVNARNTVDDVIQRDRGRNDPVAVIDRTVTEPGARYVDFLVPGLLGLNTMGGGLWGVGFLLVNFRIMKLLKRFVATPMPRHDFLLAVLGSRLTFLLPDVAILLGMGVVFFKMPIRGSLLDIAILEIVGALAFAGLGLLVASRAQTTESVSGMINMINLPMALLSGAFFPYERFPAAIQPVIRILPLTQLIDALRKIILEGAGLIEVSTSIAILAAWAVVTFVIALRGFRWT